MWIDRKTDRHEDANSLFFRNFENTPKNGIVTKSVWSVRFEVLTIVMMKTTVLGFDVL
jgi:hypothetical protein